MTKELGAAVWGAGWVSGEHLKAYDRNAHCRVVAVGSRTKTSARRRVAEAGLSDVAISTDLREILGDPDVDIVSVCTPAYLHADDACRAAEAGKHVLIEKPIVRTLDELTRLRDTIRATGVKTCAGFVLRWNPMVQIAKRLVDEGWLGKIIYSRLAYLHSLGPEYSGYAWARTRAKGGSLTLLGACHPIDAVLYLTGKKAKQVCACGVRGCRDDLEWDPTVAGLIRFEDDTLCHIAASLELGMPYCFPIELMGSEGAIRDGKLWSQRLAGQTDWAPIPTVMPDSGDVAHHAFADEIDHFVDCILTDTESHASVENTAHAHEICLAMDQSAARGGEAVHLPLAEPSG